MTEEEFKQAFIRLCRIRRGMIGRCTDANQHNYKYYGQRGISVCSEWTNDFLSFFKWAIEHGYSSDLSIDRINNDGNYEPDNCRWATILQQNRNQGPRRLSKKLLELIGQEI